MTPEQVAAQALVAVAEQTVLHVKTQELEHLDKVIMVRLAFKVTEAVVAVEQVRQVVGLMAALALHHLSQEHLQHMLVAVVLVAIKTAVLVLAVLVVAVMVRAMVAP
jgi:hypothetical protein